MNCLDVWSLVCLQVWICDTGYCFIFDKCYAVFTQALLIISMLIPWYATILKNLNGTYYKLIVLPKIKQNTNDHHYYFWTVDDN